MAEKILVVDDDIETLRLVGLMLQRQGYQIVAANNGSQALASAKTEQPDLILLDVMMPDMDGYEVTRQLRADSVTANIPILMFTAKSQVDDKVTGYDSGVDDYLTKPTHPAELTAHVKVLLSRGAKTRTSNQLLERGQVAAVLSSRGGTGSSSIALNVGISLVSKTNAKVIAAEVHPGLGNWGLELGINKAEGFNHCLEMKTNEITAETVKEELVTHSSGLFLLLSSYSFKDVGQVQSIPQMEAVINQMSVLADYVLLDIGNNIFPGIDRVLALCNEAIVVVEPHPVTVLRTKTLLEDLFEKGFGKSRLITTVLNNRVRSDMQMSWTQVQEALEQPISQVISPVPEMAYKAAVQNLALSMVQPDGLTSQQYGKIADLLAQRIRKK